MPESETIQLDIPPELLEDEDRRRFNANCWRRVLLLGKLAVYRYQRETEKLALT